MRASEEAQAATSWLRPHFDNGEILGTIWTRPREPREAGAAWPTKQRGKTMAGPERRGAEGATWGDPGKGLGAKGTIAEKGRGTGLC